MNNNTLVIIDKFFGYFLYPILLIFYPFIIVKNKFTSKNRKILIIKFLGSGNFVSISNLINENCDLITVKSNINAINYFANYNQIYLIDDKSIFSIFSSLSTIFLNLFFKKYNYIINLEVDSCLAKFLVGFFSSKFSCGISNLHKSIIDYLIYDRYFVSTNLVNKKQVFTNLIKFKYEINLHIKSLCDKHQHNFLLNNKAILSNSKNIVIAPSCSKTDNFRRLSNNQWKSVISKIPSNANIAVLFDNINDLQYLYFKELSLHFKNLNIKILPYSEFVNSISLSKLVITIDSQALHVAQSFSIPTIAIYGPTSPFSINITDSTFPIYRSLICSPCTHKYFNVPCRGKHYCMNIDIDYFFNLLA